LRTSAIFVPLPGNFHRIFSRFLPTAWNYSFQLHVLGRVQEIPTFFLFFHLSHGIPAIYFRKGNGNFGIQ
jgi:hypothetical protein